MKVSANVDLEEIIPTLGYPEIKRLKRLISERENQLMDLFFELNAEEKELIEKEPESLMGQKGLSDEMSQKIAQFSKRTGVNLNESYKVFAAALNWRPFT